MKVKECPDCDPEDGYYVKYIAKYNQYYCFDNEPIDASDIIIIRGGTVPYCANCGRRLEVLSDGKMYSMF